LSWNLKYNVYEVRHARIKIRELQLCCRAKVVPARFHSRSAREAGTAREVRMKWNWGQAELLIRRHSSAAISLVNATAHKIARLLQN
jgi:hypothetical protein